MEQPIYKKGQHTPAGKITDIMVLRDGSEFIDWLYELDGDFDRRYSTDEIQKLTNSGAWEKVK